jgi:integrase
MHAWQIPYLGWQKLPADLSAFEIEHFFTLRAEERRAVRSRYKSVLRLGAALQIGFLRMCGRPLDAVQRVPAPLLKHLGEQLVVPSPDLATLRGLYSRRRRTLYEHQAWAIEFLGMTRFEVTDTDRVVTALTGLVRAGLSGDQLLAAARRALFERRFLIPGPRRGGMLVRAAVVAAEREALAAIERDITVAARARWLTEIVRPFGGRATLFEYLEEPPGKFSPATIQQQAWKVEALLLLGAARYRTDALTPAQLQAYARQLRRRRPSRLRSMTEPKRTLEASAFVMHSLLDHTDTLIELIDRRGVQLWRHARETATRVPGAASSSQVFVDHVRRAIADAETSEDDRLSRVVTLLAQLDAGHLRPPCVAERQRDVSFPYCDAAAKTALFASNERGGRSDQVRGREGRPAPDQPRSPQCEPESAAALEGRSGRAGRARRLPPDLRAKAMISVAYSTMARRAELVGIRVEDLSPGLDGDGTVTLRTKGGAIQERYLAREARIALEEWRRAMKIDKGPVFLAIKRDGSVGTKPITTAEVARTFKRIAKCIGLDGAAAGNISGHSTRIGAAQDLTTAGAALPEIMAAGGWWSPGMPARYARRLDARRGAMRERLTR